MYKKNIILMIISLCYFPFVVIAAERDLVEESSSNRVIQVLFIGNSYTYYNNLPEIISEMSMHTLGPVIKSEMHALGSASLQSLWEEGYAEELIKERKWDYVILQENSNIPANSPWLFTEFLLKFAPVIKETGAETLIFFTWAHENKPRMYNRNSEIYQLVSEELDIPIVPVGIAWNIISEESPNINLYMEDGTHPNILGSYTAACVFLKTFLQNIDSCPIIENYDMTEFDVKQIQNAAFTAVTRKNEKRIE